MFFFCPANIYRRNLGSGQLGRPNPKVNTALNFYLRREKKIPFYSELYTLQLYMRYFQISFYLFFLNILQKYIKNMSKTFTNIYTKYSLITFFKISSVRLLWSLFWSQRNLVHRAVINNEFGIKFLNSKITSVGKMDFHNTFTINMNYTHICIIYIHNLY